MKEDLLEIGSMTRATSLKSAEGRLGESGLLQKSSAPGRGSDKGARHVATTDILPGMNSNLSLGINSSINLDEMLRMVMRITSHLELKSFYSREYWHRLIVTFTSTGSKY
jgi:hypothetical protein